MYLSKTTDFKGVYSVSGVNDIIFVSMKNGIIQKHDLVDFDKFSIHDSSYNFSYTFKHSEQPYLVSTRNEVFIDRQGDIVKFLTDQRIASNPMISDYLALYSPSYENRFFSLYSLTKKKILWKSTETPLAVLNQCCFKLRDREFAACDIETGKVLWEIHLESDFSSAKWYKLFAVYKGVLIVCVEGGFIAGYNIENGKKLWTVGETNNSNLSIDKDGKLKGVTFCSYFETDVLSGKYRRVDFAPWHESNKDPNFFDSQRDTFVIIGEHIITTDSVSNRIGAFNLKTLQYDWFYTEESATGFPASKAMKYFEPFLFVIDNADTLHLYTINKDQPKDV